MRYLPEFIPYKKWDKNRIILFKIMIHGMLTGVATACSLVEGYDYYKEHFAYRTPERIKESHLESDKLESGKKLVERDFDN